MDSKNFIIFFSYHNLQKKRIFLSHRVRKHGSVKNQLLKRLKPKLIKTLFEFNNFVNKIVMYYILATIEFTIKQGFFMN